MKIAPAIKICTFVFKNSVSARNKKPLRFSLLLYAFLSGAALFAMDKPEQKNVWAVELPGFGDSKSKNFPLHCACEQKLFNEIRSLVKKGANVNEKDKDGKTPLQIACQNGDLKTVILLLWNGARMDDCALKFIGSWRQEKTANLSFFLLPIYRNSKLFSSEVGFSVEDQKMMLFELIFRPTLPQNNSPIITTTKKILRNFLIPDFDKKNLCKTKNDFQFFYRYFDPNRCPILKKRLDTDYCHLTFFSTLLKILKQSNNKSLNKVSDIKILFFN